jgi:hypothetical protein
VSTILTSTQYGTKKILCQRVCSWQSCRNNRKPRSVELGVVVLQLFACQLNELTNSLASPGASVHQPTSQAMSLQHKEHKMNGKARMHSSSIKSSSLQ